MLRLILRSLSHHKLRLSLTALSIALGVAFVAGSFVFTDSIQARFDTLFGDVYAGVDATVRPHTADFGSESATLDAAIVDELAELDLVGAVAPSVGGFAQLIDSNGVPIGGQGPPTLGFSWVDVPALNSLEIEEGKGRAPTAPGELVMDAGTAGGNGFQLGDDIDVAFLSGVETFELVGIAKFGTEDNLAGATLAVFELGEAQRLFGVDGYSQIDVLGDESTSDEELVAALSAVVPDGVEVVTGDQQTQEELAAVTEGLGFVNTALLAFAGVAVFVGAFIIQNTFRITVAQRTKELALLRALGADARQVTRMVVGEALTIATLASAVGVALGVGLAVLLKAIMDAAGFGLPDGPLTVEPRTIVIGMAVGITVTLVSSLVPARRAARVPPIAAMRDTEAPASVTSLRQRSIAGGFVTVGGAVVLAVGLSELISNSLVFVGVGALGVFLGVSILAPLAARPVATFIGWPLPRLLGVPGKLAQDNTRRQPRRTAATASALMIGIALVGFVAVFAASTKASVESTFEGAFPADVSVHSTNPLVGVGSAFVEQARMLDEFETISAVQATEVRIAGQVEQVGAVDPDSIDAVYTMGAEPDLSALQSGLFVREDTLDEDGYAVGDVVTVEFAETGAQELTITGTFTDTSIASFMISSSTFEANSDVAESLLVFGRVADDVDFDEARTAIEALAAEFGTLEVQTAAEVIAAAEAQTDQFLALFQGLLGLAIVIAVLGITNTLALSIVERTREIGLLRAVGMSRRQVRRMVRWEAVIISVFGAMVGVGLGIALGWSVVTALAEDGFNTFTVPGLSLVGYVGLAAVAGILAAIGPARSASRLNVLDAISYE